MRNILFDQNNKYRGFYIKKNSDNNVTPFFFSHLPNNYG